MQKQLVLILFFVSQALSAFSGAAISHGGMDGHAGDNLMLYIRSKYIAHKFSIPYLLPYSGPIYEAINLFHEELRVVDYEHQFSHKQEISSNDQINPNRSTLYILNHFFKWSDWGDGLNILTWGNLLKDEPFLDHLRHKISMKNSDNEPEFVIPSDRVSIAVHVRTGRGIDGPGAQNYWYYKFPVIDYFVSQIIRIAGMINKPLYVHMFTDDIYPHEVANQFISRLASYDIVFKYRSENDPRKNVLEDLIFMSQFDCLIRGMSHYSQIAQIIGKFKLVVHPLRFSGRNVVEVGTVINDQQIMRDGRFKVKTLEETRSGYSQQIGDISYRTFSIKSYLSDQSIFDDFM